MHSECSLYHLSEPIFNHPANLRIEMQEERELRRRIPSWNTVLDLAVVKTFGQEIKVLNRLRSTDPRKPDIYCQLKTFIGKLEFEVEHCSPEPIVKQPCVVDITTKDFYNYGDTDKVETVIETCKKTSIALGNMKYRYCVKQGVRFDEFKFGNQIVTLSMTGGSMMVGDSHSLCTEEELKKEKAYNQLELTHWQIYNENLLFYHDHKEKLTIPPQTKIMTTITTSSKKFEQDYTLRFRARRSEYIFVQYFNRCHRICSFIRKHCCCSCCCQPIEGILYAKDILQDLPSFEMDDRYCWFTLDGTLIWLGEECSVKINQSSLV